MSDEVIGIIDIGSARVSGAIMTEWPKVSNELSEGVDWQDTPDWNRFINGIEISLKKVLNKLATGKHPKPEEFFVFLSSPFFIGRTSKIKASESTPFEITPPLLADMVKRNYEELDITDKDGLVSLENELMQVKLDGYVTPKPVGQKAKEIELNHWQSESPAKIIKGLKELIQNSFPKAKINFHSFAYSAFAVFSELLNEKDWILLDTGNELTDILVIKNGCLAEHLSFPIGKNALIRSVTQSLQTVPAETESVLNRYALGQANHVLASRLEPALALAGQEWLDSLSDSLSKVLEKNILPEEIYLFGDEPSDKLFIDFIKKADSSNFTVSRKPLRAFYAEKPLNQALHHLEGKVSPPLKNSFLLAEALFCASIKDSKLSLWPFNQLAKTMNDIIKTKKSLRDIFPESKSVVDSSDKAEMSETPPVKTYTYESSSRSSIGGMGMMPKVFVSMILLAVVVAGGFALSSHFAKVTVKVTPRQGRLMVSNTYEASKDSADGLKYVLASNIQLSSKVNVPANGTETVKTKASGQITVYNNTVQAQKLVASTRFQTGNLIYRTPVAINVPGQTKNASGETVPGQLDIKVVADQAGPEYNITSADFTIPGFKGSDKFTKFSAKSKTAISGGAVGPQPKVAEADLTKAKENLQKQLLTEISGKLKPQVPDDYVLFEDAVLANFSTEVSSDPAKPGEAVLKVTADATGILFNKNELSSYLAKQQVPDYKGEPVEITNWSAFKFGLLNDKTSDISSLDKISFKLDGTAHLAWDFDSKDLKQKLQGSGASNYKNVFDKYFPMVQTANIIFSPPWVRSIPADPNKIIVETNISKP